MRQPPSSTGATGARPRHERHAGRQRHPQAALRARRDDAAGAGRCLQRDPADHHRAGGRQVRAFARTRIPHRARTGRAHRRRLPLEQGLMKILKWSLIAVVVLAAALGAYMWWVVASFDTQTLPDNHGKVAVELYAGDTDEGAAPRPLLVGLGG